MSESGRDNLCRLLFLPRRRRDPSKMMPISPTHLPSTVINSCDAALGRHLTSRLVQIDVSDVFTVPSDFNLTLLDHLVTELGLTNTGCCNELNAG
ncbi:hypothetical protein ACFX2A_005275 [Malus domestica]